MVLLYGCEFRYKERRNSLPERQYLPSQTSKILGDSGTERKSPNHTHLMFKCLSAIQLIPVNRARREVRR